MKKNSFTPSPDFLETRIAMSSGIKYLDGLPVLTSKALSQTFAAVNAAFTTFATKGENYNLLSYNLTKAIGRLPFNVRDGLKDEILKTPADLKASLKAKTSLPVIAEAQIANGEVTEFIQAEVEDGIFVYRP